MSGILGLMLAGSDSGVTLVGTSAVEIAGGAGTTVVIDKPSGVVAGDLMLAFTIHRDGETWTPESGWTEVADLGADPGLAVAWKVAGGAEPSDYTFTATAVGSKSGVIGAWRHAAFDVAGSFDTSNAGAAIDAPSVTLSNLGLLIAIYAIEFNARTFTTPSGMLALLSDTNTPSFAIFTQQLAAGATGVKSSTPSGGGNSAGILIGLRSA